MFDIRFSMINYILLSQRIIIAQNQGCTKKKRINNFDKCIVVYTSKSLSLLLNDVFKFAK